MLIIETETPPVSFDHLNKDQKFDLILGLPKPTRKLLRYLRNYINDSDNPYISDSQLFSIRVELTSNPTNPFCRFKKLATLKPEEFDRSIEELNKIPILIEITSAGLRVPTSVRKFIDGELKESYLRSKKIS